MAEVDKEALKAANQYLGPVSATPQARPGGGCSASCISRGCSRASHRAHSSLASQKIVTELLEFAEVGPADTLYDVGCGDGARSPSK